MQSNLSSGVCTAISKELVDSFLGGWVHLDEWGPGAFEAFARKFAGGVEAEFAAAAEVRRGVVEDVGWAFGEDGIALGIGIGAEAEEDVAGVMNIDIVVHHDHVFGEHHLAHPPEAVHDFVGLHGVGFADADDNEVVKDAFGREGDIDNFGEVHPNDGEEEEQAGAADVEVFHGRYANDGGGVDGIATMGDGGNVENGVEVRQGVIAGVITKGSFHAKGFGGVDIAFNHEIGIGRDFEVVGFAFDEFDGFFAQVTGQEVFIHAVGQWRGGAEWEDGVATEENGDGHSLAAFVVAAAMARADFLELPVHAGALAVVDLHAIHADVAFAGIGVLSDNAGKCDESAAIMGPAELNGEVEQGRRNGTRFISLEDVGRVRPALARRGGFKAMNDFLARAVRNAFGFGVAQFERSREQAQRFAHRGGRFGFD